MSSRPTVNKALAVLALTLAVLIVGVMFTRDRSVGTLPTLSTGAPAVVLPMVSPVGEPLAVRAIVDIKGQCLWVLARDGNVLACEDTLTWRDLPQEVDSGQFFRGESLD
jgi:hypothetical protein